MQVRIGNKIKELRKRDGRKQEDLANALGVTCQAVSRWEADSCYPDMNLIPSIANYFHISIDTLFGYSSDRDNRIKEYVTAADRFMIKNNGDPDEVIKMLKNALEEFPAETRLQRPLAHALVIKGSACPEKPNPYLEEAAKLFEELSKNDNNAINPLLNVYSMMGEYDKAEARAKEQPMIRQSSEALLASIFDGKKGEQYSGKAILALLHELGNTIDKAVDGNNELNSSIEGIRILSTVIDLYKKIFGGKDYGKFHSNLCMLNLSCAKIASNCKEYEKALNYLLTAYEHYLKHSELLDEGLKTMKPIDEKYSSPLLSEAGFTSVPIVVCRPEFFKSIIGQFPKKVKNQMAKDQKYEGLLTL
jgi:transcriptional regulator with XRE-family HTH domain